jgi:beta-N-acetylhexosaminidase
VEDDRRGILKTMLALGAVSLAGACSASRAAPAQAQATLKPAQLAGQRVVFSYPGLTVPAALLQQIKAGQAAGVIFFGGNISNQAQIASVIQQLRQAQHQSPVSAPLLLMTDQEGGEVRRLPGASGMSKSQVWGS